jgi:hypothetical protein
VFKEVNVANKYANLDILRFFHTIDNFFIMTKSYILNEYFVLPPPNYLVGGYVYEYMWYVEKIIVLSHGFTIFNCILITPQLQVLKLKM